MATLKFSRRIKDFKNESAIGNLDASNGYSSSCINGDATNQDEAFGMVLKGDVDNYGSTIYLLNFDYANNVVKAYNFDSIIETDDVNGSWKESTYYKKGNYVYKFYGKRSGTKLYYDKYEIKTTANSRGVYELQLVSSDNDSGLNLTLTAGDVYYRTHLIIKFGYFVFGRFSKTTSGSTMQIYLSSMSIVFDGSGNITSFTLAPSVSFGSYQTTDGGSGNHFSWLHNYDTYLTTGCGRTTGGQQITGRFFTMNSGTGDFTGNTQVSGIIRNGNDLCLRDKFDANGKSIRISLGLLKYYNNSYSLVSTGASVANGNYFNFPAKGAAAATFSGLIMNNGYTSDSGVMADGDVGAADTSNQFDDLFPSRLQALTYVGNDTYMLFQTTSVIQILTVSDTNGGITYESSGNFETIQYDIPSGKTTLVLTTLQDVNSGTLSYEVRFDSGSWTSVSLNTKITIPGGSLKVAVRPSFTSPSPYNNSPILDKINLVFNTA